jgi:NAD(P)-dependent dehydrogenase (short-subunit alcohol dehydrogenase family)
MPISDLKIIFAGGSSGLGSTVANMLAADGAKLVVSC